MRVSCSIHKMSLKAKLISCYLVILGIGGLATSLVGSWIVSSTIMRQARSEVDHDLATARMVYGQQLRTIECNVQLAASSGSIQYHLSLSDSASLLAYLNQIKGDGGFDFLTLTDQKGRVVMRTSRPGHLGDDASAIPVVRAALSGRGGAGTEILSAEHLENEDPILGERARLRVIETPRANRPDGVEETSGMVLVASAPIETSDGEMLGALYGGVLLNRNSAIVHNMWDLIYRGERFKNQDVGAVTILQNDVRISTSVKSPTGERALGTRVSKEVHDAVLTHGEAWSDRTFMLNNWYISGYEPIRGYGGNTIGILSVGVLEKAFASIRNRIISAFFVIAAVGFLLITAVTYYMVESITRPIVEMVEATRNIAAGCLDRDVRLTSEDEIGQLAASFNAMLRSLRQAHGQCEQWGRTLEEKVKERTQELAAMQATVARTDRLASLGKLAAGVAHEINNPLGGILSLTSLTLEDMREDDPNRENLEEVIKQSERCRDIVRGLLKFSRQPEAEPEPVAVNDVLRDTLSLLEGQSIFFNIEVVKDWADRLPPVMADKAQLQQVFMNIILNAAQAMKERGTVTIQTRCSRVDGVVEIVISDTGCGIPPGRIDRVFDPFFTTKSSGDGTGLGLSIAYGIVTKHGGSISIDSQIGKGSTLKVRLPSLPESQGEECA
jgi:two-component system NtrC family sensor kinase